jgi:hypothetical protein
MVFDLPGCSSGVLGDALRVLGQKISFAFERRGRVTHLGGIVRAVAIALFP